MREALKRKQVIGIVGGMGSYATLNFFSRLLAYFPAEREWDRPRIIIDNYCTMPSRVRALIYKEKYKEVYMALANSIKLLIDGGATDIVLVCNTAHCFLKDIFKLYPEYKNYVIDIIALCARELNRGGWKEIYLIATEGTVQTNIYTEALQRYGIQAILPSKKEQAEIRKYIEAVKQNKITQEIKMDFAQFIYEIECKQILLGCTEIPVLCQSMDKIINKTIIDPLEYVCKELKIRGKRY